MIDEFTSFLILCLLLILAFKKNYTGFFIVVVPKSPLTISANLKKMFSEFFSRIVDFAYLSTPDNSR